MLYGKRIVICPPSRRYISWVMLPTLDSTFIITLTNIFITKSLLTTGKLDKFEDMAHPTPQIVKKDHFSALPAELRIMVYSFLLPGLCKQQPELHLYGTNEPCKCRPDENWAGEPEEDIPQHLSFGSGPLVQPETSIYSNLMATCRLVWDEILDLAPRFTLVLHAPPIKFNRGYVYPCCHRALPTIPWRYCGKVRLEMVNWQFTDNWNVFVVVLINYEESLLAELPHYLDMTSTTLIFLANRVEKLQDISFLRNFRSVAWDDEATLNDVADYHRRGLDTWGLRRSLHRNNSSTWYDPTIVQKTSDTVAFFDGPTDRCACSCRDCMNPCKAEAKRVFEKRWAEFEERHGATWGSRENRI